MELKKAKEQLESLREDRKSFLENDAKHDEIFLKDIEAIDTILKILDMPEEEVVFYGTRSVGKTVRRTYEMGLIVGTKRERVYWEDKIKEKIEEIKENYEEGYAIANQGKLDILEELLKGE